MKTLKQLRSKKTYRAVKRVIGGHCIEDIPDMIKEAERVAKENDTKAVVKKDTIEFEGFTNFIFLPKMRRETSGTITLRSKDYTFLAGGRDTEGYGPDLKADMLTDYGFAIENGNEQTIEYHIEEAI